MYLIILIIKNNCFDQVLQRFILCCFFWNGKTEYNYVNPLSIISTLSPSPSRRCFHCWRLVVVFGISLMLAASFCNFRRRILVVFVGISFLALLSCCHCCIVHGSGGVPLHGWFLWLCLLFVIGVVSVFLLLLAMCCNRCCWRPILWLLLSASAPCCRSRFHQRLVVVAVLSLSAADWWSA